MCEEVRSSPFFTSWQVVSILPCRYLEPGVQACKSSIAWPSASVFKRKCSHGTPYSAAVCRESERYFLGESMLESAAVGIASEQYIQDDAACTVSITPLPKVPSDSELPQAQLEPDGKSGSDLFCTKLAIPEDACSVDGPPTPDNEEADRVCMPAAKRQRLDESSPTAAALAVARILQLI